MRNAAAALLTSLLATPLTTSAPAQEPLVPRDVFSALAAEYSGEAAQEHIRQIVEYHRIQGSPMMAEVAEKVVLAKLKAAGLEASLDSYPSDGKTRYGTYISPMGWDVRGGELWLETPQGEERLCRYADVPMCVSTYSKGGTFRGELVDVGPGTADRHYEGKDVKGKVALASGYAANVVRQAVLKRGAAGVVIYPDPADRPDHPDMVRYNGIWPRASELAGTSGGFQISTNQYARLAALLEKGPVRVRGTIDATLGAGRLTLVHASIPGTEQPGREVLVTAHLDHPKWSANDNASGSAAMLEMARTLNALVVAKKIPPPKRTIHFMWVPEYFGTFAYVANHPEARRCGDWDDPRPAVKAPEAKGPCILANLNLDMVGEDTAKTNSHFYMTKSPASVPSFLDALLADVLEQARAANLLAPTGSRHTWPAGLIPYAQGSDHDVFLGLGVPASMFGHDPDWTHHTSEDTADKTDATELRRVGVLASAVAHWLAAAGDADWARLKAHSAAANLADDAARLARLRSSPKPGETRGRAVSELERRVRETARELAGPGTTARPTPRTPARHAAGGGPRRLALVPFDASAFEPLAGEDLAWWTAQHERFATVGEGLATQPNFDLLVFEAVNFMDGKRSTSEIAEALTAWYGLDIDAAWVDRLTAILASLKLVAKGGA